MKPINVGLLGIGTVGGGTFTVLRRNEAEITRRAGRAIRISVVADKDTALAKRIAGDSVRITDDAFSVVTDPEIDIVVELIGGYGVAKELVLKAAEESMQRGGGYSVQRVVLEKVRQKLGGSPFAAMS